MSDLIQQIASKMKEAEKETNVTIKVTLFSDYRGEAWYLGNSYQDTWQIAFRFKNYDDLIKGLEIFRVMV